MGQKVIHLEAERFYHIYNHANGKENLFVKDDNYIFFLKKYAEHISPYVETYAYCLLPNHFHLLVRIKSEEMIKQYEILLELNQLLEGLNPSKSLESLGLKIPKSLEDLNISKLVRQKFSNLFNSYTQAFNKQQTRMGSLFMPNFKRKEVSNDDYLRKVLHYIHFNPIKHQLVKNINDWAFTSYHSFLLDKTTKLAKTEVMDLFGGKDEFEEYHTQMPLWEDLGMI